MSNLAGSLTIDHSLHKLAASGNFEAIKSEVDPLLTSEAGLRSASELLSALDEDGRSVLSWAAVSGHAELVDYICNMTHRDGVP
jgi:ankyrin repeat protein